MGKSGFDLLHIYGHGQDMLLRNFLRSTALLGFGALISGWVLAQPLNRDVAPEINLPVQPGGFGYRVLPVLSGLSSPVAIVQEPGQTNRLYIVEQVGRITVITNLMSPNRTTFLNLATPQQTVSGGEQGMLGLAFHPNYADNGRFFVFRTVTASTRGAPNRLHDRLSEFRVSPDNPNQALTDERILFQQNDRADNHNGGDVHFGPDGYLYVSLGDEGGGNDPWDNGQTISKNFFSSILRLDVDERPGSLLPNSHPANEDFLGNYHVPPDNPYVGATHFNGRPLIPAMIRTEFWNIGLRNPWRFSFDPMTGELWIGDVGQGQRESIVVTSSGANHGWAFREGTIAGPRVGQMPQDFLINPDHRHAPPVYAYSHGSGFMEGRSVTGGVVYRGNRLSQIYGWYVYSDYVSGNVWALRRRAVPGHAPEVRRIMGRGGISGFGVDPSNGDILLANHGAGTIERLDYLPAFIGEPLPETLEETGAFADLETLEPAPGLVPYDVNLSFWSDNALKKRWVAVPAGGHLGFREDGAWESPVGTVWVKHFEIETEVGNPESRRRLETRFLVRNSGGVYGVTYRWDSPTSAVLVGEAGEDEDIEIQEGEEFRTQTWRYPGRSECLACHTPSSGGVLSFQTAQLNRDFTYPDGTITNQILALASAGYFQEPPEHLAGLRAHATPDDADVALEARVRSYLAVNCAGCHNGNAVGSGLFDARIETATDLAGLINGTLRTAAEGDERRVIVPGDEAHSWLLTRMSVRGSGQMPPIASNIPDPQGVALLKEWIAALVDRQSYAEWVDELLDDEAFNDLRVDRDSDGDGASDHLEYLTRTDPIDSTDAWGISMTSGDLIEESEGQRELLLRFVQPASVAYEIQWAQDLQGAPWELVPLNANRPYFPATDRDIEVNLSNGGDGGFYRVRLFGP